MSENITFKALGTKEKDAKKRRYIAGGFVEKLTNPDGKKYKVYDFGDDKPSWLVFKKLKTTAQMCKELRAGAEKLYFSFDFEARAIIAPSYPHVKIMLDTKDLELFKHWVSTDDTVTEIQKFKTQLKKLLTELGD